MLNEKPCRNSLGIIHSLRNASRGEGGYLDLLRYYLIYMESFCTEHYGRGRGVSEPVNLALRSG